MTHQKYAKVCASCLGTELNVLEKNLRTSGTLAKPQWLSSKSRALAMRSRKDPSGVCASALLPGRRRRLALLVTCESVRQVAQGVAVRHAECTCNSEAPLHGL